MHKDEMAIIRFANETFVEYIIEYITASLSKEEQQTIKMDKGAAN
jgi:hypothetical protein